MEALGHEDAYLVIDGWRDDFNSCQIEGAKAVVIRDQREETAVLELRLACKAMPEHRRRAAKAAHTVLRAKGSSKAEKTARGSALTQR